MDVIRIKYDDDVTVQTCGLHGIIKCPKPCEAYINNEKADHFENPCIVQADFIRRVSFDEFDTLLHLDCVKCGLLFNFQDSNDLMERL